FATQPMTLIPDLQRELGGFSPWAKFVKMRKVADDLVYEEIEERRARGDEDGDDVLAMLLAARHEDGSPMSAKELRDELMTMLVAGHETTASSLGFAFVLLARHPQVAERVREGDEDYVRATVQEVLRARPVLP